MSNPKDPEVIPLEPAAQDLIETAVAALSIATGRLVLAVVVHGFGEGLSVLTIGYVDAIEILRDLQRADWANMIARVREFERGEQ